MDVSEESTACIIWTIFTVFGGGGDTTHWDGATLPKLDSQMPS